MCVQVSTNSVDAGAGYLLHAAQQLAIQASHRDDLTVLVWLLTTVTAMLETLLCLPLLG